MVNDYTIYDEIGRASNNRAFQSFYRSRSSHVFSQCLSLISGAYMLEVNKHARWIQLYKCISIQYFIHFWHGISVILILMCGIAVSFSLAAYGFSSFWLTVFGKRRPFTVLRYRSFSLSCLM